MLSFEMITIYVVTSMEVAIKKSHHEIIDLVKLAGRVRILTNSVQFIFTTVAIVRIS